MLIRLAATTAIICALTLSTSSAMASETKSAPVAVSPMIIAPVEVGTMGNCYIYNGYLFCH